MALTDFFRINLPYGIKRFSNNEWFVFNREYLPLGWNSTTNSESIYDEKPYSDYPIYTKYKGLTDEAIFKIIKVSKNIQRNMNGEIETIYFYDDRTNPQSNPKYWNEYFEIIKEFSKFSSTK